MKRLLALILSLMLLVTLIPQIAMADAERKSGAFTYKIKGNGTAAITGYDWATMEGQDIFIPRMLDGYTVTEIAANAFSIIQSDENGVPVPAETWRSEYVSKAKGLVIPDTVKYIGAQAFMGVCFESFSITIPYSVEFIGYGAFSGCVGVQQFTVDATNPVYATIDGVLYNKQRKELIAWPWSYSPMNHSSLNQIVIPEGIVSIGDYAFWRTEFGRYKSIGYAPTTITLPTTLKQIGSFAFAYSTDVDLHNGDIVFFLPGNVEKLGKGAFYRSGFTSTTGFDKKLDLSSTKITMIPDLAFCELRVENTTRYKDFTELLLPTRLVSIGNKAFKSLILGGRAKEIVFPTSLQTIGDEAFANVDFETETDIGFRFANYSSLISIGNSAFRNSWMDYIMLPESLESIGDYAFADCRHLNTIAIPANVTTLGLDVCDRSHTVVDVTPGSYAALWASENGYTTQQAGQEDTSWLN